ANCAIILRRRGRAGGALAACDAIIATRPDAAEPHFSRGNILKELNRPGEAAEAFRRALALRPDFAEAYVTSAISFRARKRFPRPWRPIVKPFRCVLIF